MFFNILLLLITILTPHLQNRVTELEYYFEDGYSQRNYNELISFDGEMSVSYLESLAPFEGSLDLDDFKDLLSNPDRREEAERIRSENNNTYRINLDFNLLEKSCNDNLFILQNGRNGITHRFSSVKGAPSYRKIKYLVRDSIRDEGWTLHDEYKEIDGRQCQRVTTTFRCKGYTGWADMSVPIPKGPYIFRNTPGLIVQLARDDRYQQWSLKSFKMEDDDTFNKKIETTQSNLSRCEAMTREDVRQYFRKYEKDVERRNGGGDCLNCESTIIVVLDECFDDMEEIK